MSISLNTVNVPAYSRLATVYDRMMEHVDYQAWADYIHRLIEVHHKPVRTICELACGTGSTALALGEKGYRVEAFDASEAMIRRATEKKAKNNERVRFSCGDMLAMPYVHPNDAVLCLYDSVNYMLTSESVGIFFQNAESLLNSKGLLIFDACTEKNSRENFDRRYEWDKGQGYKRMSRFDADEKVQYNEIFIYEPEGVYFESHRQRIYSIAEWNTMIGESGFSLLAMYENLTLAPGSEASERIHFVLEKAA